MKEKRHEIILELLKQDGVVKVSDFYELSEMSFVLKEFKIIKTPKIIKLAEITYLILNSILN